MFIEIKSTLINFDNVKEVSIVNTDVVIKYVDSSERIFKLGDIETAMVLYKYIRSKIINKG